MKILIFLLFSVSCYCQTLTEKWNQYSNRYEYFNSGGNLVAYKQYNSLARQWEYYEIKQSINQPRRDDNFELQAQVALAKQQKYNQNKSRIEKFLKDTYQAFKDAGLPQESLNDLWQLMNDIVNSNKLDLSIDSNAEYIINQVSTELEKLASSAEKDK